jgi:hypothetical protein
MLAEVRQNSLMEYTHIGNANWGQVLGHGVVLEVTWRMCVGTAVLLAAMYYVKLNCSIRLT